MKETWYQLPEEQCERLRKQEMTTIMWCLSAVNSVAHGRDDLQKRLSMIPNGKKRWNLMLGQLRSLMSDMLGTTPYKQRKTIQNTMNDMALRLVPKGTQSNNRVTMDADDLALLIRHAKKDLCTSCVFNGDECRKCELYQILESISPQEDYGDGTMCPYMKEDWWDR